jgi:hypothetical protein
MDVKDSLFMISPLSTSVNGGRQRSAVRRDEIERSFLNSPARDLLRTPPDNPA